MVSNNMCALAINVCSPLLDCNRDGKEFSLMSCIIVRCTSQLFAVVCNGLKSHYLGLETKHHQ